MKTEVKYKPHITFRRGYWRVSLHKGPKSNLPLWHKAHWHISYWNTFRSPQERLLRGWK